MNRDLRRARDLVQPNQESTRRKADDTGASCSSAISVGTDNYDVFLSFSGKDTRKTFVDHLYNGLVGAGIHVFRDDDELREGEQISANLLQAIKNSKIFIPIFSPSYASSRWCLLELVQMTECMKSTGHVVLPIFYRVEPAHVRYQKGSFGDNFSLMSGKYFEEDVARWKRALQEVASVKGWESEKVADGREGELVKMVVKKVWSELKKAFQLVVTEQLVGVDNAVEDVLRLLDDNRSATQIVGIHGMGGIGKTTLAKIVYNKLSNQFEHRSFIEDIRESSSRPKGVCCLQNQLIRDILKMNDQVSDNDEGIRIMESRFKCKKVLLLLDDVDDIHQLEALIGKNDWFETGSRILITTRIRSVLDRDGVNHKYELKEISKDKSLILFSRHAFLKDSPPCEFESLSRAIVATTGGLPLSLEVIGSSLLGKKQEFWRGALKKLEKKPHMKVQEKLKISYDALEKEEKHIFLDIACFFIGADSRIVSYMWDACDLPSRMGIETLSFMSLIKLGDDGKLKMHDQLRDLGREIVRQEDDDAPWRRSRLWIHEEALEVLQSNKEKDCVRALLLNRWMSQSEFTTEQFEMLPNLRFLVACYAKLTGESKGLLPQLRCLTWTGLPELPAFAAASFRLEKLAVLNLSGSTISELWEGWSHLKGAKQLKVLNLRDCLCLKVTPDLTAFQKLEILILEGCFNLEQIHPSIGEAKGLIFLNLQKCRKLQELPREMGKLEELKELYLGGTPIEELPPYIDSLKKLEVLHARRCELLTGPANFDEYNNQLPSVPVIALPVYDLNECFSLFRSSWDPDRLSTKNSRLWRSEYSLHRIPKLIGKLEWLTKLNLSFSGICELPESVGDLKNLKILDLSCSLKLRSLPSSISKLGNLEELSTTECRSLEGEIHIEGLSSLKILQLSQTCISGFPDAFDKLSCLERLDLSECQMLKSLPQSISKLPSLQHLYLNLCDNLQSLPELPACLTDLTVTCQHRMLPQLSHLIHLKRLSVKCCRLLESMPELPSGLLEFHVSNCNELKELSSLSSLAFLSELQLKRCGELTEIKGLEALKSLAKLTVVECEKFSYLDDTFNKLSGLKKLEVLDASLCESLEGEIPVDRLSSLKIIKLESVGVSGFTDAFDKLSCLEQLDLSNCKMLQSLPQSISKLPSLQVLLLAGCHNLQSLPELPARLTYLTVTCQHRTLPQLSHLIHLKRLSVKCCRLLESMPELPSGLLEFHVSDCNELKELSSLSSLAFLSELQLKRCGELTEIKGLEALKSLAKLTVVECEKFSYLDDTFNKLSGLKKLEVLDASLCESLEGEIPVDRLSSLKIIKLESTGVSGFTDAFDKLSCLKQLDLSNCKMLQSLPQSISKLPSLKVLLLTECHNLQSLPELPASLTDLTVTCQHHTLPQLSHLIHLTFLSILDCRLLESLPELPSRLWELTVSNCDELKELPSLSSLAFLSELHLHSCGKLTEIKGLEALKSLAKLTVVECEKFSYLDDTFNKLSGLKKLEVLDASLCESLEGEIPVDRLSSLKIIKLESTGVSGFTDAFDKLSCLKQLDLSNCKMLQSLPQSISKLPSLQVLLLTECHNLQSLPELPASLTDLTVTCQHHTLPQLSHLIHLKRLSVKCCRLLESMPELPSGLLELTVSDCDELKELPSLSSLAFLSELHLESCGKLTEIKGLEALKSLEILTVERCEKLSNLDGLEHLWKNLEVLDIQGSTSIETLPDLSCFNNLIYLDISGCPKLGDVRGLEKVAEVYK